MALLNFRETPQQYPRFHDGWDSVGPGFRWSTGMAFLAAYLACNLLTQWHEYDRHGITLWSPDIGLSLALLMESAAFAPFVFAGAVLGDLFILRVQHSLFVCMAAEFLLTVAYICFALALKNALKFSLRQITLANVVIFLSFVPLANLITSALYCGVLYSWNAISSDEFLLAMRNFWIGDTLGMITVIPALMAVLVVLRQPWRRLSAHSIASLFIFFLGVVLGFSLLIGSRDKLYDLFYLLFFPVIWVAIREGFGGAALALLATQLVLALITIFVGYGAKDFVALQLLMLVLSITGLLLGVVATERRAAATLLRAQERDFARMATSAMAGEMGAALAHEISQPLSSVAAYLHAARRLLLVRGANDPVMDALVKAEAEAQRGREVLERIRDFVSGGNLDWAPLDLPALTEKMAAICREDASARGVTVETPSLRPVPAVNADRLQIEQVVGNLLANAIDSASDRPGDGGRVTIRVLRRGESVAIEVEDNGPGVAPEVADCLFEAYRTTKPRGMGLGLHLSQRIVQRHSGRIVWEPAGRAGARFIVSLPIEASGSHEF